MEDAKPIQGFPDYLIGPDGSVYNARNGFRRRPSRTGHGSVKITLYRDGVPYTRSLARLVANAFLYNDHDPEIYDTPIHLDNDQRNNHVDNLMWRPRWFAVKYQQQYWRPAFRHATTKVEDVKTGEIYHSLVEVCQKFGLLYIDVLRSCNTGETVFPTRKIFRFV